MDDFAQIQSCEANPLKKLPGSHRSAQVELLLIGYDPNQRLYTDEVLRQAGFGVRTVTSDEAKELARDVGRIYPLVMFSNTLSPRDVSEIGTQMRQRSPKSKLLLMLGPDSAPIDFSIFDAAMDALEGPAALIQAVRDLAESSVLRDPLDIPA